MIYRELPITPTQQAANGALDMFVDGYRKADSRQLLVGLSVLRSATEAQVNEAMTAVQSSQRVTTAQMQAMLVA